MINFYPHQQRELEERKEGGLIMGKIQLYPHQAKELEETKDLNKVAFYHD